MNNNEALKTAERISLAEPDRAQEHMFDGMIEVETEEFKDGCTYSFHCNFVDGQLQDVEFFCENGYSYNQHQDNFYLISQLFPQWDELIEIVERKAADAYFD